MNFVCFLAAVSNAVALAARIIEGITFEAVLTKSAILVLAVGLLYFSASRSDLMPGLTTLAVYVVGVVLWPALFFTSGGAVSGMAAYFTIVIVINFLLLKGTSRVIGLIAGVAAIVVCYASDLYWGFGVLPEGGLNVRQLFTNNLESIVVAGFFMGFVIVFQNSVYMNETRKAEAVSAELKRNEELLTLVNKASTLLLTAETDRFEEVLAESMGNMAICLDIDRVYIWKSETLDGEPIYRQLHRWISPKVDEKKTLEAITGINWVPRVIEWDRLFTSERRYIAETNAAFSSSVANQLVISGIKAIMAFPVFLRDKYWGFVSFDNCHEAVLCTEREAQILQSGSLLLANAVERNNDLLLMNERLAQQQLMSDISKSFISKESMETLIRASLKSMGAFIKASRVLIAVFEKNSEISRPVYYWFRNDRYLPSASQRGFSSIIRKLFPQYQSASSENLGIYCDNTLKYEGGRFSLFYERGGIKSFICAPIYVESELWGVMSIEEHDYFRQWNENDSQLISTVTSAISNAIARDVIEKGRSEAFEQALQASRAKGDFLSNMSHEMRTPLNAIIGMTVIGKTAESIEKKDYAFDKIDGASKHLLGVINDILDMSKIEANKLDLSHVSFVYEKMLQNVVNVINFRVEEKRQKLYVNIDKDIPRTLIGDDQRLSQVIANLLSNAVKFTDDEGTIHLDSKLLAEEGGMCRLQIEVCDTGIGITEEQKSRLFHSFEQAEAGTARKFGGTGLGLTISKRIVELMDGDIWVESEPGVGSRFVFTALLKRGSEKRGSLLADEVNWGNIRLLAVDDEPEILRFFLDVSKNLQISCDVASTAEEAIELLRKDDNYNIFCFDYRLPGMDGIELTRYVRAKTNHKSVVLLFSSIDRDAIENTARSAGVDKFLPKPLFQSALVDLINESLGSKNISDSDEGVIEFADYTGHTILLAEDVEINREIVLALLESTNLIVDCAENGVKATELYEAHPSKYEIIFMDLQMPEMDGFEATRHIRSLEYPQARSVPIVAMTANVFKEDIERCIEAGMNDHIGKPINLEDVLAVLKKYLRNQ